METIKKGEFRINNLAEVFEIIYIGKERVSVRYNSGEFDTPLIEDVEGFTIYISDEQERLICLGHDKSIEIYTCTGLESHYRAKEVIELRAAFNEGFEYAIKLSNK